MSSCSSAADGSVYTSLRIPLNSIQQVSVDDKCARSYGIAILFPSDDKEFVFQHILQIESDILKLIDKINLATTQKKNYLKFVYEAWLEFCGSMCLLQNAPRLRTPVWLSLTDSRLQDQTADEFCQRLAKLSVQLNTKESKFFLSTLVSSVLMSHLSWVASITPPDNCAYDRSLLLGTAVIDSRQNPYNAKAAQFVELLGGIGLDNPTARTVVFGTDAQLITEILYVLSYFIRCSSVENKRRELLTPDLILPMHNFVDDSTMDNVDSAHLIAMPISSTSNNNISNQPISSSVGSEGNSFARSNCATSPPAKMRAISVVSPMSSPNMFSQNSNPTRYALIVDNNQVVSTAGHEIDTRVPQPSAACPTAAGSSSRSHLGLSEWDRPTDFGRTLLAGVCSGYSPHFVLSGVDKTKTTVEKTYNAIHRELCNYPEEIFPTTSINNLTINSTNGNNNNNFLSLGATNRNGHGKTTVDNDLLLRPLPASCSNGINIDPLLNSSSNDPNWNQILNSSNTVSYSKPAVRGNEFKVSSYTSPSSSLYVDVTTNNNGPTVLHRTSSTVGADSNSNYDSNSQHSCLSRIEPTKPSAIVILADSSQHSVKIISGGSGPMSERTISSPSETIAAMLEEFVELYKQKCASTFLISFLEDRLGSILLKSNVLVGLISESENRTSSWTGFSMDDKSADLANNVEMAMDSPIDGFDPSQILSTISSLSAGRQTISNNNTVEGGFISMEQMSRILDCHCSDLRLILNVASVYAPGVLSAAI